MKIRIDSGLYAFKAETPKENQWLSSLPLNDKSAIEYGGRGGEKDDDLSFYLIFNTFKVYAKSSLEDNQVLRGLRDAIYFSRGVELVMEKVENDEYFLSICKCQHCQKNIANIWETEWKTCNECAEKCEHEYKVGPVHGPGVTIAAGRFCKKCGRGEAKEEAVPENTVE